VTQTRYYSSTAQPTVLTGTVTPSQTNITVQSTVGFPPTVPYLIALDYGTPSEELALVTLQAGLSLTVTRAYDGTAAAGHDAGAPVRHVTAAVDFTEFNTHGGAASAVHGVVGAIVGTTDVQTLTNKILTTPGLTNPGISGASTTIAGTIADTATWNSAGSTHNNGTYATPGITNPTITGTVGGSASYTAPTLTGTVTASAATISSPTVRDETVINSAIGVVPEIVNAIAGTTADIFKTQFNGSDRFRVLPTSGVIANVPNTAVNVYTGTAASGFTGNLIDLQVNAVSQFKVNQAGSVTALGSMTTGTSGQFTVSTTGDIATTGIGMVQGKYKTGDTSRASTTTMTADPDLVNIPVVANGVYVVDCSIIYSAIDAADLKIQFTAPASTVMNWHGGCLPTTSTGSTGTYIYDCQTLATTYTPGGGDAAGNATQMILDVKGLLRVAGTAGNFGVQWAQNSSNATATILRAGSYIQLNRIA